MVADRGEMMVAQNVEAAEALGRAEVYQTLAQLFRLPDDGERLPAAERIENLAENLSYWSCPADAVAAARRSAEVLRKIMAAEFQLRHQRVFGHTISKEFPPYETEYGRLHAFRQSQELADISGFYRAFGFDISIVAKERCDFIGVELEFMYVLAMKEAYALSKEMVDETKICRDAQRRFLESHLGTWVPAFATLLQRGASDGLFADLALLASRFVSCETSRLGSKPRMFDVEDFGSASAESEDFHV